MTQRNDGHHNGEITSEQLEYPNYDIVIVDDHPLGEGHFN